MGALAGHACAHLPKELTQLDDVRLAGGVANLGHPTSGRGGQERRLGTGDRRFFEVHGGAGQSGRGFEHVPLPFQLAHTHRLQGVQVHRNRPAGREVTAGGREPGRAATGEQRAEQQNRPSKAPDQPALRLVALDLPAPDAQRAGADAVDLRAEVGEQSRHHLDVADARHVGDHALFVGQQARGNQRQRRVLVAAHDNRPRQRPAAFNQ